jgi:hypothetical protein
LEADLRAGRAADVIEEIARQAAAEKEGKSG